MTTKIASPKEAREKGLTRYFTGRPCVKGHIAERFVSNRGCIHCIRHSESGRPARRRAEMKYQRTNPNGLEKGRRARNRRRAKERGAEGFFTAADINRILVEQNYRCVGPSCDADFTKSKSSVDHKIPLSRKGSNWPENIQMLCIPCNCSKRDKTDEEWRAQ